MLWKLAQSWNETAAMRSRPARRFRECNRFSADALMTEWIVAEITGKTGMIGKPKITGKPAAAGRKSNRLRRVLPPGMLLLSLAIAGGAVRAPCAQPPAGQAAAGQAAAGQAAAGQAAGGQPAATQPPSAQVAAQTAPLRLTLREAVEIALKQNPQVQIANLNTAVTQENQIVARSALLPQANLAVSETVMRENLEAFLGMRVPGFPGHSGPFGLFQGGANGSVPLFDLTAWHRWRQSQENTTGARAQELTVREQNVQLVVSQYLGSLRSSADVSAARSRVELAKALFDQAGDLQKNGVGTGIDTLRANVQYQNEQQRLIESRTALATSLFGLARLLNIDPHQTIELADLSEFFHTPAFSADETMERAFVERPEMKALASEIRSAELDRKIAQDARIPHLALNGQWSEEGLSPATAIPAYDFAVSFDVPLYTGGRIRAEVATAGLNLKKLAQQQTDLRNQIAQEVKTAAAQLEAAKSEVDVANLGIDLAREEVTQARDRFQAGVANNIEVITAQDELARANDNQIVALYRYNQARADLARATGQMETLYAANEPRP